MLIPLPTEKENPLEAGAGVAAGVVVVLPELWTPKLNGTLFVDEGVVDGRAPKLNCWAPGVVEGGFPKENVAGAGVATGVVETAPKLNGVLFVGVLRSTDS